MESQNSIKPTPSVPLDKPMSQAPLAPTPEPEPTPDLGETEEAVPEQEPATNDDVPGIGGLTVNVGENFKG